MNIPGALRAGVHWSYPGELKNTRTTQVHRHTDTQRQRYAHTIARRHTFTRKQHTNTYIFHQQVRIWRYGHWVTVYIDDR